MGIVARHKSVGDVAVCVDESEPSPAKRCDFFASYSFGLGGDSIRCTYERTPTNESESDSLEFDHSLITSGEDDSSSVLRPATGSVSSSLSSLTSLSNDDDDDEDEEESNAEDSLLQKQTHLRQINKTAQLSRRHCKSSQAVARASDFVAVDLAVGKLGVEAEHAKANYCPSEQPPARSKSSGQLLRRDSPPPKSRRRRLRLVSSTPTKRQLRPLRNATGRQRCRASRRNNCNNPKVHCSQPSGHLSCEGGSVKLDGDIERNGLPFSDGCVAQKQAREAVRAVGGGLGSGGGGGGSNGEKGRIKSVGRHISGDSSADLFSRPKPAKELNSNSVQLRSDCCKAAVAAAKCNNGFHRLSASGAEIDSMPARLASIVGSDPSETCSKLGFECQLFETLSFASKNSPNNANPATMATRLAQQQQVTDQTQAQQEFNSWRPKLNTSTCRSYDFVQPERRQSRPEVGLTAQQWRQVPTSSTLLPEVASTASHCSAKQVANKHQQWRLARPGRSPMSLARQTSVRLARHRLNIQQQRQEQLAALARRERSNLSEFVSIRRGDFSAATGEPSSAENSGSRSDPIDVISVEPVEIVSTGEQRPAIRPQVTNRHRNYALRRSHNRRNQWHRLSYNLEPDEPHQISTSEAGPSFGQLCFRRLVQVATSGLRLGASSNPSEAISGCSSTVIEVGSTQADNCAQTNMYRSLDEDGTTNRAEQPTKSSKLGSNNNEKEARSTPPSPAESTWSLEGKPFCKICHMGSSKLGDRLISPCKCSGTMRYIHCGCLLKWLELSNRTMEKPMSCELCSHEYTWHKRFNFKQMQLPKCSIKDMFLHLLFIMAICSMLYCALAPILSSGSSNAANANAAASKRDSSFKQQQQQQQQTSPQTEKRHNNVDESGDDSIERFVEELIGKNKRQPQPTRRTGSPSSSKQQPITNSIGDSSSTAHAKPQHSVALFTNGYTSHLNSNGRLASDEKFILISAAAFFVSFFLAIYVQTKTRDTLYGLCLRFVHMNRTYYITEYDHGPPPESSLDATTNVKSRPETTLAPPESRTGYSIGIVQSCNNRDNLNNLEHNNNRRDHLGSTNQLMISTSIHQHHPTTRSADRSQVVDRSTSGSSGSSGKHCLR